MLGWFMRNLRAVFNYGIKLKKMTANRSLPFKFEETKKPRVTTLTPGEAASLMEAAESA